MSQEIQKQCSECINNGACAYNIMLPYIQGNVNFGPDDPKGKIVNIDKCLLPEILQLWESGIKTTGCCCGHGILYPFIGVREESAPLMLEKNYIAIVGRKNTFTPKTIFTYGIADKGFNWWQENFIGRDDQ